MKKNRLIQTMTNIPLDEFAELYKIKTNTESLIKYMQKVKDGEPYEFMVDDIIDRMECYLSYYNKYYDRTTKITYVKEGGKK